MSGQQRLPVEQRKRAICAAAKTVFLRKGFQETTMEDVIAETGMSKGGVYHHYKSTAEMLYDLMCEGNAYRFRLMDDFKAAHPEMTAHEMVMEAMILKMLDKNEYKSLYAMFLIEAERNPVLKALRIRLFEDSKRIILGFIEQRQMEELKYLITDEFIAFLNSIIVATEVLDVRETFLKNKDLFREMICLFMERQKTQTEK